MNLFAAIALFGMTVCDQQANIDYVERAREATWNWPDQKPSLFACTMDTDDPYQIMLEHIHGERFLVHVSRDNKLCLKFQAHAATVFDRCRQTFVYAQFSPHATGCTIVAFDLEAKKQLWSTQLEGIGAIKHSGYGNSVSLGILFGVVEVDGWETAGKYREYLDLKTGKVIAHRLFEKGFK